METRLLLITQVSTLRESGRGLKLVCEFVIGFDKRREVKLYLFIMKSTPGVHYFLQTFFDSPTGS